MQIYRFEIDNCAASVDDLLSRCDAVYIASPHYTHFDYARQALLAGKHVLCETPLVFKECQAAELFEIASKSNLVLMAGLKTAFCPAFGHCLFSAFAVIPQNYLLIAGASRSILIIQIITRIVGLLLLIPSSAVSLKAVCLVIVVVSVLSWFLTLLFLRNKTGYSFAGFMRSIAPSFLISLVMMFLVITVVEIIDSMLLGLVIGIISGVFLYVLLSYVFNRTQSKLLFSLVTPYLKRN